jgi:hypothetical protein
MRKGKLMSHHLDAPSAREDGRVDLCDLYVFDGDDPDTTVLIMTVNPNAGKPSPTTFHPEVVYEFKIDTNDDALEDLSYRIRFGELDAGGRQKVTVLRAAGADARSGTNGELLAQGTTGEQALLNTGGRIWAGLTSDPFYAAGAAAFVFLQAALTQNSYVPNVFDQGFNVFGGAMSRASRSKCRPAPWAAESSGCGRQPQCTGMVCRSRSSASGYP